MNKKNKKNKKRTMTVEKWEYLNFLHKTLYKKKVECWLNGYTSANYIDLTVFLFIKITFSILKPNND